jgi:hypothetical protein
VNARAVAAVALAAVALPAAAGAADVDPVRLTVTAPDVARSGQPFAVGVAVAADAGALDPRAGTLRLGVRLAPVCGATFATTRGPTAIDAALAPQPAAGAPYAASARGSAAVTSPSTVTVCAFLYDDDGRQWATDTDTEVVVGATGDPEGGGSPPTAGSGPSRGSACAPAVAPAARRIHRRGRLLLRYRACARGRHRFALLPARHGRGVGKAVRVTRTGRATTRLGLGRLPAGRYRVVMVLPSGRHLRATRAVTVVR